MLIEQLYLAPRDQAAQDADDQLTQEIDKYNTTLKSLEGLASEKDQLRQQLVTLQGVAQAGISWGTMLNELRAMTPGDLWFDKLDTDSISGTLKVTGAALDYNAVAYFHNNLQHSLYFQNPTLSKTNTELGAGSGPKLVKFEMGFGLKPPTPPPVTP
jgi:Tfp pilus assembly protein PilN